MSRTLVISLDGYESTIADTMMAAGQLPALKRIREQSARFLLDHGSAKRTGLSGEHVSTGMSPEDANRSAAVYFDKASYQVWQQGAQFSPFPSKMVAKTVVFDLPYFDLSQAANVQGIVAWGAHDPGTELLSNPDGLVDELYEKHGLYPATNSIYAFAWPSREKCRTVGIELVRGVELRSKVALWLLKERFPDWQLGLIGVSEAHSALEALWHGYDDEHPLHHLPSAPAAGDGVRNVYKAIDRLIGDLTTEFEDATIVIFSMHGMGPNRSDVPSMVLLPELLHRHEFGRTFFQRPDNWTDALDGIPVLKEGEPWKVETPEIGTSGSRVRDYIAPLVPKRLKKPLKQALRIRNDDAANVRKGSLQWMPAARYQPLWPKMRAFALPSFYDGRIRINLIGREQNGLVSLEQYNAYCEEIGNIIEDCRDPVTGERIVDYIEFNKRNDPLSLDPSDADMIVIWKGAALSFEHPTLGKIGPVPYRRTGGHTGKFGMAYIKGDNIAPEDGGTRSSFDVVPTLFELLNEQLPSKLSGHSLLGSGFAPSAADQLDTHLQ